MSQNSLGGLDDLQLNESEILAAKQAAARKKYRFMTLCISAVLVIALGCLVFDLCRNSTTNSPALDSSGASTQLESTGTNMQNETTQNLPIQADWSDWMDSLPAFATAEDYLIEEQVLYRSRNLETTTSTEQSSMSGWEQYDTVEGTGEFGNWADWSTTEVSASDTREVETQTRYRYRDKETTTGSSSTMSGWDLYDTTYTWGNYGNWSSWSSSAVSKSDSRDVETKTQYSYRTKNYTTSSSSSLSGWTCYDSSTSYGSWGSWSDWSNSYVESSDLREVETRYIEPTYRTEYNYSRYNEYNYASTGRRGWNGPTIGYWGGHYCQYYEERGWSTDRLSCDRIDSGYGVYGGNWYNEQSREVEVTSGYTQYRYRDRSRSTTYYYYQWSDWSSYSDSYVSSNSDREVSTCTLYRYRDRQSIPTYHFWRWGNWSDWSTDAVTGTDNKQVETMPYYRYRDRILVITYYFKRWSDWSNYSTTYVAQSDTVDVETKTQYRYKSK